MRNSGAWREIRTETVRVSAAFAMVVGDGRRDRLERLWTAGLRVPPVLTGCQGYLLAHTDMLRTLLAHGMSPDLMNWQHQTLLHLVCQAQDYRGRTRPTAPSNARPFFSTPAPTSLRGTTNIDRHRSPGRRARMPWRWWSFSSHAAPRRTFPTMNRGPRRSRGPNGANMRRSCRSSGSMALTDSCGRREWFNQPPDDGLRRSDRSGYMPSRSWAPMRRGFSASRFCRASGPTPGSPGWPPMWRWRSPRRFSPASSSTGRSAEGGCARWPGSGSSRLRRR